MRVQARHTGRNRERQREKIIKEIGRKREVGVNEWQQDREIEIEGKRESKR